MADSVVLHLGGYQWTVQKDFAQQQSVGLAQIIGSKQWNLIDLTRCFPNVTLKGLANVVEWLNGNTIHVTSDSFHETARTAATLQISGLVSRMKSLWGDQKHTFNDATGVPEGYWKNATGSDLENWVPAPATQWTAQQRRDGQMPSGENEPGCGELVAEGKFGKVLTAVESFYALEDLNDRIGWNRILDQKILSV